MADADEKIARMEVDLAHQVRLTEVLNEVVYEQGRQIEALAQMTERLKARIEVLEQHVSGGSETNTSEEASPWKDPEM